MEARREILLKNLIEEVIRTGQPVGSQSLVERCALDVSPATVRNWFQELEREGFIDQPHTSAGRVPTEKGYRWYVDEAMEPRELSKRERSDVESVIKRSESATDATWKLLAKKMAEDLGHAVLIGWRAQDTYYTGLSALFAEPEFHDWQRVVSLGVVLDGLDDVLLKLRRKPFAQPTSLIGSDCPFGPMCASVSLTISPQLFFTILGPMRMKYQESFAYLRWLQASAYSL